MGIHVGHPKRSLCTKVERNPVGVVRVTAPNVFASKMAAWAAILNDIKSLFDVRNPQTIPDLGVKFQTTCIWSIHFWEIAVHGSTYERMDVRTDGRSPNYKPPNPSGWGLIIDNAYRESIIYAVCILVLRQIWAKETRYSIFHTGEIHKFLSNTTSIEDPQNGLPPAFIYQYLRGLCDNNGTAVGDW